MELAASRFRSNWRAAHRHFVELLDGLDKVFPWSRDQRRVKLIPYPNEPQEVFMKNTMYAALVALVAGCGFAHADKPGLSFEPYEGDGPAIERELPPRPRRLEPCQRHPLIPFCSNEDLKCIVVPGRDPYLEAIIIVRSTHGEEVELAGPNSPDMGIATGRVNRLKEAGYCHTVSYKDFPPAPVGRPVGAPPVIRGGGGWYGH